MTILITARGTTLREACADAATQVLALAVDPAVIEERDVREVRAHGPTAEALLCHWINECLYVHELEAFACRRVELAGFDAEPRSGGEPLRLHSFLHGEEMDPERHRLRARLKGVAPREVVIEPVPAGYEIRLTLET